MAEIFEYVPSESEPWYKPGKSIQEFHDSTALVRVLIGARGCIHPETPIYDPTDKTNFTAKERAKESRPFHVLSLTPQGLRVCQSTAPFVKGACPLHLIEFEDGTKLRLAPQHKLLTSEGWTTSQSLNVGDSLAGLSMTSASSDDLQHVQFVDGRNHWKKAADFLVSCFAGFRLCGGRPQKDAKDDQSFVPSQYDVHGRIFEGFCKQGLAVKSSHTHPLQPYRLSSWSLTLRIAFCLGNAFLGTLGDVLLLPNLQAYFLSLLHSLQNVFQHHLCPWVIDKEQLPSDDPSLLFFACRKDVSWIRVSSIKIDEHSEYYDLTVPESQNYFADGFFHHNSGKTTAVSVEAVAKHCWNNPGAKVYLLRKTELSQEATSIETYMQVFGNLGPLYKEEENGLFQRWNDGKLIRIPSKVAVEKFFDFKSTKPSKSEIEMWLKTEGNRWCSFLEFKGIPDAAKRDNKLRGFEASMIIFVEADLLNFEDFQMSMPCLRWRGADGKFIDDLGIILDTNPPGTKHWIAKLEEQETQKVKKGEKSLFQFWHISTYENEHNLPKGYIENSIILPYQNNPPMLERMLWGRYADAFDGQAVFHEFNMALHTGENLEFPKGAYLVRGWDFGQSNAVVWSAYWIQKDPNDPAISNEFWWDLHEQALYDSDVEKQCKGVMEITAKEFPFWNDRTICLGLLDFCDPAGAAKKDTGSSIAVLNTYGIYPGYKHKDRGIPKTIAIMNRLLAARTKQGEVVYKIDKINCPVLYAARAGGYRYPRENEPNYGSGLPKKDGVYCHLSDCNRYSVINCMRLDFMDVEAKKDNTGILASNPYKNPAKRYK